jgi:hypothetical protein
MRICSVLFLALLATSTLHCQTLDKFYIGAFWVGGNATDTIRQPNPGSVATYNEATNLPSDLPQGRFNELQDLGLNLAGIELHHNSIVRSDENGQRNVLRDITDSLVAAYSTALETDIDVCIFDWGIHTASELNRVILNPESSWDFEYCTVDTAAFDAFGNFPFYGIGTDRSILEQKRQSNCVRFRQPSDTVRGLRFERKRELTARKNYWGDNESHHSQPKNLIAGLYHLSVILADDVTDGLHNPPNSSATVLTIRIFSTHPDSITKRVSRDFVVPGSAFYDGPTLRAAPFEYHLAQIEMRIDSFDVRTPGTSEDAWMHSALTVNDPDSTTNWERTDVLVADRLKHWKDLIDKNLMGPLEIEVFANSNAHFLVDAVCLSSPAAYGLFASGDSHAGVHSGMHTDFMTRLSAIASDRNGVGSFTTSRIPLMTVQEQRPSIGSWPSARVVGAALADSLPHCLPYSAHGAEVSTEDMGPLLEFHRNMVSGYYTYSVDHAYPRMCEDPDPSAYYDSLYQHYSFAKAGRMRDNVTRYRSYAVNRALRGINAPWIPFVQNHSNMFVRDADSLKVSWDRDPLREPNAAELKLMCNIALAHGADGIMFYQYNTHGARIIDAANACWPRLRRDWVLDSTRQIHTNSGSMGFLGANNLPRVCDTNGENKWDSTKAFISDFLRPVGNLLREITWERSKSWYCGEGEAQLVSKVISQRQDALDPIDGSSETFVETAEFSDAGTKHLLVINGRAHREGHRHITVKLAPSAGSYDQWKVTNVQTGDIWIVRPNATPDSTSTANGFTEYFAPGSAALYRLEPFADETLDFDGECLSGNLFIEPEARLYTETNDNLKFQSDQGIFCRGEFIATNTMFGSCDIEQRWAGIHALANGYVHVENCTVSNAERGVAVGSDAYGLVSMNIFYNPGIVLTNLGGELYSYMNTAQDCGDGYAWSAGYRTRLLNDMGVKSAIPSTLDIGLTQLDQGITQMKQNSLSGFDTGIEALGGTVMGDSLSPGYNRVDAMNMVLHSDFGFINFGDVAAADGTMNCFILQNPTTGFHAVGNDPGILAVSSYWEPSPPILLGFVNADDTLAICPYVPFVARENSLSKSASSGGIVARGAIERAFRDSNYVQLRQLLGSALASTSRTLDRQDLDLLRLYILKLSGFEDMRDTLVLHLLRVPDVRSKLFAAEVLAEVGRYREAYEITQAWSFAGSRDLRSGALLRAALYAPLAIPGGYRSGLRYLDTLRNIVGSDSTWRPLFELYPIMYSGLGIARSENLIPKVQSRASILDHIIPSTIEMGQNYPNPFSTVTSFTFKLPDSREVKLTVHDMLGREVAVVKQGMLDRGVHSVVLHVGQLKAGVYMYRLCAGADVLSGKMLLVR